MLNKKDGPNIQDVVSQRRGNKNSHRKEMEERELDKRINENAIEITCALKTTEARNFHIIGMEE